MKVSGSDEKNFLMGVVDDHVLEEVNKHDDIELQGCGF